MSAASSLMKAIHTRLVGDAGLVSEVGQAGFIDRNAVRLGLPCIVYGELESRDYSTATEKGEEHFLTLELWCEGASRQQAQRLSARVQALLGQGRPTLGQGSHLVNLVVLSTRERLDGKTRALVTEIRLRAVTETI
ncbi:DUF3168 domain-containing protein [Rhizobium helianthi]|uniref:DUF3168 domain-containing protein n=1 Tax=Rhizobium helianthi TaxID=1132695 RepID=A0ABW4M5R5_9HYPH